MGNGCGNARDVSRVHDDPILSYEGTPDVCSSLDVESVVPMGRPRPSHVLCPTNCWASAIRRPSRRSDSDVAIIQL